MIFTFWVIVNLLLKSPFTSGSFQSGVSSSIGVLSTAKFPTEAAENLPINGTVTIIPNCGWHYAAAGTTAPGFYTVPNFGTFNVGAGNIGQANVGYNNTGFGNYGTFNTGRLNNGKDNIGYLNDGSGNMGALNTGTFQIGDNNNANAPGASPCIGYNNDACSAVIGTDTNQATFAIGVDLQGSFLIGSNSTGSGLIGQDNYGANSIGFQNSNGSVNGNIGVLNIGDGLVGYNNTGNAIIGQDNSGSAMIGYNNTASNSIIGFNQIGSQNIGVENSGELLIGFGLTGTNSTGGSFDYTSEIVSDPIIFDPTDTITSENIGNNFNSQPSEIRSGVTNPFIVNIESAYQFNLDFPAILSVVDLGCPGDVIEVYDKLSYLMTTTFPRPVVPINCTGLNTPEEALADPKYSRNFITLQPGYHLLTFSLVNSSSGTLLAFKLDLILPPPPCKECDLPVPPLEGFNPDSIAPTLPPFALPDDIHLPDSSCCPIDRTNSRSDGSSATSSSYSSSCSSSACFSMTTNTTNVTNVTNTTNTTYATNTTHTVNTTNATNTTNTTITTNTANTNNATNTTNTANTTPWCKSKNFRMLRDSFVTHTEALGYCLHGLARPATPRDQLEITSLLFQCPPTNATQPPSYSGGQWIGSDWNGRPGQSESDCLVAHGESVLKAKDCNSKRRFICKLF